jgi:DNA-directed RNA polymerase specialized sigma24 family protein
MIELAAPPAPATAAPTVNHDRLDHVISRVAAGDRVAFRRLYAFMAVRVWRVVAEAPLGPADAVAVARSTFVEVWHSARAGIRYDAREWMATVTTGRVNDRLRIIDASGRHWVHPAGPGDGADRQQ